MKTFLLLLIGALLIGANTTAQSFLSKLSSTVTSGEQAKSNLDKVKSWLPKRKGKTDSVKTSSVVTASQNSKPATDSNQLGLRTTLIIITGTDFSRLKKLCENLEACEGVKSVKMKYSSSSSTIEVSHSGTTESLLKLMEETSKDIFTEKNIEGFEDGKIQIKV